MKRINCRKCRKGNVVVLEPFVYTVYHLEQDGTDICADGNETLTEADWECAKDATLACTECDAIGKETGYKLRYAKNDKSWEVTKL